MKISDNKSENGRFMIYSILLLVLVLGCILTTYQISSIKNEKIVHFPVHYALTSTTTLLSLSCNIGISLPMLCEVASYYCFDIYISNNNLHFDRFLLAILVIIPNIIIIQLINYSHVSLIFAATHAFQYVAAFAVVLAQSNQSYPNIFTLSRCSYFITIFGVAGLNAVYGFGRPLRHISNILSIFLVILTLIPYFYILSRWYPLNMLLSLHNWGRMDDQLITLFYIFFFIISIIIFPGILAAIKQFEWSRFDIITVNCFIYGFGFFCILLNCLTGDYDILLFVCLFVFYYQQLLSLLLYFSLNRKLT